MEIYNESTNKNIVFWTYASASFQQGFEAMKNSFIKFHQDITLIRFNDEDISNFAKSDPQFKPDSMNTYAYFNWFLGNEYKKVVHIDSDILVCSRLSEVIDCYFDVGVILDDSNTYYNLGLFASMSEEFNKLYLDECNRNYKNFNDGEQGVFNDILSKIKDFRVKNFDDELGSYTTKVAYSLREIYRMGENLYFRNKILRIIHMVAHWNTPVKQLDFTGEVDPPVLEIINLLKS